MIEVNKIKEIYPGHFQVILDFPSIEDLRKILDLECRYVWVVSHNEGRTSWLPYNHTLYNQNVRSSTLKVRNVKMEYLIDTDSFLNLLPNIKQTVHLIQTNTEPPHYLDIERLKGKQLYDLLKTKLDYRLEIEIPGSADYAPLVCSDRNYLESVIKQLE